ncbi:ubiquitin-conjugating enzyme E2 Z [Rhipicephalus sanguineus]|uniref:Ubiquitin-conjugating enzyme E2 Z n=1 Tax=Rhipicephalus sanguineus TaxID=34632 RepID=A0A9D4QEM7_RHISA|nr:ubiquitin-conjugating enzyme E2 Z [Rhipicephalus sanguineus]KAH7976364.1 hypothetical protein HPB52_012764 [Rhipicephalus sanguineus]
MASGRPRRPVLFKRDEESPSPFVLRVQRDLAELARDPPPGIYAAPEEIDVARIYALVVGPPDTPYEGGFLFFHLTCTPEYPFEPPKVRFLTTDAGRVALHPFLYRNGNVSLSIIGTYAGPEWSSSQTLSSLLLSLQSLLSPTPYFDHPFKVHANRQQEKNAAEDYAAYVRHEVVRVSVCDIVESCLSKTSTYPAELRAKVLDLFIQNYDHYELTVKKDIHLSGTAIVNPFSSGLGSYQHEVLLTRLQSMKAEIEKRREATVPDALE